MSGFVAAAASAESLSAVFLFGVPRWRPPRLSPGFDPLGIAIFRRLYYLGLEPVTRHAPLPGKRGPKPQPEAHRHQCAETVASRQMLDNDDDADTRTRPTACRDRRNPWPASIDTGSRFRSEIFGRLRRNAQAAVGQSPGDGDLVWSPISWNRSCFMIARVSAATSSLILMPRISASRRSCPIVTLSRGR